MLSKVRLLLKCALFGVYVNCVYYSVTVYLVTYTVVSWSTREEPRCNVVEEPSLEGVNGCSYTAELLAMRRTECCSSRVENAAQSVSPLHAVLWHINETCSEQRR